MSDKTAPCAYHQKSDCTCWQAEHKKAVDFSDPTTWDGELSDADALSLAMWAINTMKEPQGSSGDQYDVFDFFAEGALERLDALREERS